MVTRPDEVGGTRAWRVNAHDLERIVCAELAALLSDAQTICSLVGPADAQQTEKAILNARHLAERIDSGQSQTRQDILQNLLSRVKLNEGSIEIAIDTDKLVEALEVDRNASLASSQYIITCETARVRRGHELKLIIPSSAPPKIAASRDEKLIGLRALTCLAPDIVTAIVHGKQPQRLNARSLMQLALPAEWTRQRALLGFA